MLKLKNIFKLEISIFSLFKLMQLASSNLPWVILNWLVIQTTKVTYVLMILRTNVTYLNFVWRSDVDLALYLALVFGTVCCRRDALINFWYINFWRYIFMLNLRMRLWTSFPAKGILCIKLNSCITSPWITIMNNE